MDITQGCLPKMYPMSKWKTGVQNQTWNGAIMRGVQIAGILETSKVTNES